MIAAWLVIVLTALLVWRGVQVRRAHEELERERDSRRAAVEEALAEGFRLGAACPVAGDGLLDGGMETRDRVPAGTGSAR